MIRSFIGVEIADGVRKAIADDLRALKAVAPRVKWVKPDNFHLTLKFLGDVRENDLKELFDALDAALGGRGGFVIGMKGVFALPNRRCPRVVAVGVDDGADEMIALNSLVEETCARLGYPVEKRPYRPHITLGRVKLPDDAQGLPEAVGMLGDSSYGFSDVDEAVVFMSELRRSGPVHSSMLHIGLSRL
ncbi:MAG: RNA 2',3'-cyclic phosphodiesterase [Planctomycetota bacterium]|nr:RNA 2',3'-cyclic phosphodiesterase [Planctomycetota bacterium]